MRSVPLAVVTVLVTQSACFATSCVGNGSACSWLQFTEVVFVGRVVPARAEGKGTYPTRMVVEKVLRGLPEETREVILESRGPWDGFGWLKASERYVIFGSRVAGQPGHVRVEACSFSFAIAGNELLFAALRQAATGGPAQLVGKVSMEARAPAAGGGAAGVVVVATSGKTRLETLTDGSGEFIFRNVAAGRYHLTVASDEVWEDRLRFPHEDPFVFPAGCGYQHLYVWPNGRTEGTVRASAGHAVAGVPVGAFLPDARGILETSSFREAVTDGEGVYRLSGLPPGDVVVGMNGDRARDGSVWGATFFPGTADRNAATRIGLAPGQRRSGVDFRLPAPREAATLSVETVAEDGSPVPGAMIRLDTAEGQGSASGSSRDGTNRAELRVYVGETCAVVAFATTATMVGSLESGQPPRLVGQLWRGEVPSIQISGREVSLRVVMRPYRGEP